MATGGAEKIQSKSSSARWFCSLLSKHSYAYVNAGTKENDIKCGLQTVLFLHLQSLNTLNPVEEHNVYYKCCTWIQIWSTCTLLESFHATSYFCFTTSQRKILGLNSIFHHNYLQRCSDTIYSFPVLILTLEFYISAGTEYWSDTSKLKNKTNKQKKESFDNCSY